MTDKKKNRAAAAAGLAEVGPKASGAISRPRFAPTQRFIVIAALFLFPIALAEVAAPEAAAILAMVAAVLALMAIVDAALGVSRSGGVTASIRALTRLSLGREAPLEIELHAAEKGPRLLRVGLVAPVALGVEMEETSVSLPADAKAASVAWRACPRRRGVFRIERMHVGIESPLGFWSVRWALALDGEVRVYPNLMTEGRSLSALFLRRPMSGWRSQRQIGRGREFEKLREYLPGDGFDEIHWKATAKRGHPVTKVFQVERTQEIYAVVDASRLSGRRATPDSADVTDDTLLERQVNAALALALAAERQGDLFGMMSFADKPLGFVRAKSGPAHFQACRETMVRLQPAPLSPDFREACTFIRARLTKRALMVFLTSLDDPALAESFVDAVALVARRHLVVVAAPLPRDAEPLFEGATPETIDAAYERLGGHVRWQGLQDLGALLHRHGVHLALLGRDELAAGAVSQYMALKQRQAI